MTSLLGIWYIVDPLHYDINFIQDFPEFLILLPIVLFFSTFQSVREIFKDIWKRWIIVSVSIFLLTSFTFAFKDFINVEGINSNYKNRIIERAYDLQMPESHFHQAVKRLSLTSSLYVLRETDENEKPLMFIDNIRQPIKLEGLGRKVLAEQDKLAESERDRLIINIMMDSSITINYLNEIKEELRKSGARHIQYSTGVIHSKYPSDYPYFKYVGISQTLPPSFPEYKSFLDSAEILDFSQFTIRLPESGIYRNKEILESNRVKVKVDKQHIYLNNQE